MAGMPEAYEQLLGATIRHLEILKARGCRFVAVRPESLIALTKAPVSRPAAQIATAPSRVANSPAVVTAVPSLPTPVRTPEPASILVAGSPKGSANSDPAGKYAALEVLRNRVLPCVKCPNLATSRQQVVFGVGNPDADVMFVGEAPGADEDQQGEPFVGKAGQLLTKIIQAMGLTRADVYIANILKCRPDTPGETSGNRPPTAQEMATCVPYLQEQIDLIRPKVLVALGATAVKGLLGETLGISRLRGNWQTYRNTPLMPTYHPSYLLRNQAITEKRKVWEDMMAVMEQVNLPISEKQRNFFLKA